MYNPMSTEFLARDQIDERRKDAALRRKRRRRSRRDGPESILGVVAVR